MTKRIRKFHRNFRYNRCQRCRKLSKNLICNNFLDETEGMIYYCEECHKEWTEIYLKLDNFKLWTIRDALRRFMHKGYFRFR